MESLNARDKELGQEIMVDLDLAGLIPELSPRSYGEYLEIACPNCGGSAYIYKTKYSKIVCNDKIHCRYEIILWDYLKEKRNVSDNELMGAMAFTLAFKKHSINK